MRDFKDLRSDQQSCIDELYGNDRAFVVMRMGGGKTATCLTTIAELLEDGHRRRAIVLAPPLVAATVWPNEPAKWSHLSHLKIEALTGSPAKRLKTLHNSDADVLTVSDGVVEWLVKQLEKLPDDHPLLDVLAYDEPRLKNPRGKIGKHLAKIAPRFKSVWMFSGTPRPNGYEDLFAPARILKPGLWDKNFDAWRRRNFMPLDYHGYTWAVHNFRAKELDRDIQTFMVRAAEPAGARHGTLSAGEEYDTHVTLPTDAEKVYRDMERDLLIEIAGDHDLDDPALVAALSQAAASSKLAQIAQGFVYDTEDATVTHAIHDAKRQALSDMLDAIGGEPSAICYGFRNDVATIREVLDKSGRSYGMLGSGTSLKEKLGYVEDWNAGKLDNLILHPASAGHGVELQFGGRRMIWYCPTWSSELYDQTLKRLDRPGQEQQVYSHQIIAEGTVDVIKRNRVQHKMSDQEAFKDMLRVLQ